MDFDSHVSGVVAATVALVNALTPGWARGRAWQPDETDRASAAREALTVSTPPHGEPLTTEQADQLTEHATELRRVFELVAEDQLDLACEHVNALLRDTGAVPVLARHDGEPWHLHFHAVDAPLAQAWASAMATSLAVVLGTSSSDRLGVCSADGCDRVYVDVSRNGTRRFCSTACQNRAKAAAFRHRRAPGVSG